MKDGHGVKVLKMPDGDFVKTFVCKHRVSSRRIYPEWLRFSKNAQALSRRGIPTVKVLSTIRIPHLKRTGVIYRPLPGKMFRAVELDADLARRLGAFIARLHQSGVHFRSLHLGNVLLCDNGELGLIDISDMKCFPWPLLTSTRMRNFTHLFRYAEDLASLKTAGLSAFQEGYLSVSSSLRMQRAVERAVSQWS